MVDEREQMGLQTSWGGDPGELTWREVINVCKITGLESVYRGGFRSLFTLHNRVTHWSFFSFSPNY